MKNLAAILAILFIVPACSKAPSLPAIEIAQRDAAISVFRFMFNHNASGLQGRATSYCVGFGKEKIADPDQIILQNLQVISPKVKPATSCRSDSNGFVWDIKSRKPSLQFYISTGKCETLNLCKFEGGYFEGNLSASGDGYIAERQGNIWSVTIDPSGPSWIS